jgi:quinol monooxygenase YgiN
MVQVIFFYDVPEEKQKAYLEVTAQKIKPFWESNGCDSYSVWKVDGNQTAFVKEMIFKDESTMKRTLSLETAEPIKELFHGFVQNISRKICIQRI